MTKEQLSLFDSLPFTPDGTKALTPDMVGASKRRGNNRKNSVSDDHKSDRGDGSTDKVVQTLILSQIEGELRYKNYRAELHVGETHFFIWIRKEGGQGIAQFPVDNFDIKAAYRKLIDYADRQHDSDPPYLVEHRARLARIGLGCNSEEECTLTQAGATTQLGCNSEEEEECTLTKPPKRRLEVKIIKGTPQLYERWRENGKHKSRWVKAMNMNSL